MVYVNGTGYLTFFSLNSVRDALTQGTGLYIRADIYEEMI